MLPDQQRYILGENGLLPFEISVETPKRESLKTYLRVLSRRRKIILTSVAIVVAIVMLFTFRQKRVYEATTNVMVKGSDRMLVNLDGSRSTFTDADFKTELKIINSWPLLVEAARRAGMDLSSGRGIPVRTESSNEDWVITINADSTDPREAQRLANSVAQVYVERNLQQNRRRARAVREFLAGQQKEAQQDLQTASAALRDYEAKHAAVGLDVATENTVKALSETEAGYAAAVTDRNAAEQRAQLLRNSLRQTSATVVSTQNIARNPGIEKLQDQIADLSVQRAALLKEYQPTSDKVQNIEAQIAQAQARQKGLVSNILSEKQVAINPVHQQLMGQLVDAEGQALTARARAQGLQKSVAALRGDLQQLPGRQYQLAQLQRNMQVAEKNYLALHDRYEQMRVQEQSTLSDAEIVEPALLPITPVSPKPLLNFVLALISGLVLGLGIAAFRDALDDTVRTGQDVESDLEIPVLGAVAQIADPAQRSVLRAGGFSDVAEAFRVIRSNVRYLAIDDNARAVMVTSAFKGEGKSTTVTNLAVSLAQIGKRVAIVDTDLRNPSIHRQFGLSNKIGFSDLVEGRATLADVAQPTSVNNLFIIPAGRPTENPAEILESPRFSEVLEDLKAGYDLVLFDTPPVLGVVDASIIANSMDGILMVVGSGMVEREAAQRTVQMLKKSRARVLGAALNKVDPKQNHYGYYAYSGGYGPKGASPHGSAPDKANGTGGSKNGTTRIPIIGKDRGDQA